MSANIEARLKRLETIRKPSVPLRGTAIMAYDEADAAHQQAQVLAEGRYRPGWPLLVLTGRPCPSPMETAPCPKI